MKTTTKQESAREAAERIAKQFIGSGDNIETRRRRCADAIEAALNNQRELDAQIAERWHEQPCLCTVCQIHAEAAAAIRKQGK